MTSLSDFREVVVVDTEFVPQPSCRPDPVAVCAKELRSGREVMVFRDEMGAAPPYPIDDKTLFVAFAAAAELETHLALDWPLPKHVLDLRVEHIIRTNRSIKQRDGVPKEKQPRALLDVLRSYGIPDGDAKVKAETVARIIKGFPFTAEERGKILRYCLSDAIALEPLLKQLTPQIDNFDQALQRGEYVALTADVCHAGIPFDPWAMQWLSRQDVRQALRLRLVSNESLTHGIYEGSTLKLTRLRDFVLRHNLAWPQTSRGPSTRSEVFEELAKSHPEFTSLVDIKKTLSLLREFELAVDDECRCRTPIWAFSTITSRMAPNASAYPFTTAAWTRNLITPRPGTALVYLDFASMEFGVAAGLAQCPGMLQAYRKGDPYAGLGARSRLSHLPRARLKPVILSLQYGGGIPFIMGRLGITRAQAQRLHDLHHQEFARYWSWSDRKIAQAFADEVMIARDGWRCRVGSRTSEFTVRNWFIQANAAAIFRLAGLWVRRLGLKIVALVHDAILLEVAVEHLEHDQAVAVECLERASRLYLHGLTLRTDAKVIHEGERFADERGTAVWAHVERTLKELESNEDTNG